MVKFAQGIMSMSDPSKELEKSPCIGTCLYDPADGLCLGCKRTPQEITDWFIMTNEEKRKVKEKIHARRNP